MPAVTATKRPFVGFRPKTVEDLRVVNAYLDSLRDPKGTRPSIGSFLRPAWGALVQAARTWELGQKPGAA